MFDELLKAQGGNMVGELARAFNLDEGQAQSALKGLLPSLSQGLQQNTQNKGGLESLLGALDKGNHQRYLDQPSVLTQAASVEDGKKILGQLLGSKEKSREVAKQTSQATGLSEGLLKQMLPVVANLAMGSLSKKHKKDNSSLGGMLGSLLDQDGDGNVADDVLNFAKKLF